MIDVLSASTTKREAKSYLKRFEPTPDELGTNQNQQAIPQLSGNEINLGTLFAPGNPNANPSVKSSSDLVALDVYHVAIVVIRAPHALSDGVLHGVTRTLSQLSQLGMHCIVVPDQIDILSPGEKRPSPHRISKDQPRGSQSGQSYQNRAAVNWRGLLAEADRIVDSLESHIDQRARRIEWLFQADDHSSNIPHILRGRVSPRVERLHLLEQCFQSGTIPVVVPSVVTLDSKFYPFSTKEAVCTLSRALAGTADLDPDKSVEAQIHQRSQKNQRICSVDRIIILDSVGSIPAEKSFGMAHVFVNLEQEYDQILEELDEIHHVNPRKANTESHLLQGAAREHIKNLSLVRRALKFLPRSSSALITSPEAVARYEHNSTLSMTSNVETRPQRNILIHNILADKPIRSSSLPVSRLADHSKESTTQASTHSATFLKHGMPVTIIPDPKIHPWIAPQPNVQVLSLSDPRLDLGRLVHLIEDSFGRPLDQKHYFTRIASSLAGIIIAGAYEGGAILTWEKPPSAAEGDSSRLVPYLDKFAVLQRSQGAGGVADVVFSAMVRQCFPHGVCWRSRSNNPVNKWYFERASGTSRLVPEGNASSSQNWTMFWTTENVVGQRFRDYEEVCRSIGSSWADGKARLD